MLSRGICGALALLCGGCLVPSGYPFAEASSGGDTTSSGGGESSTGTSTGTSAGTSTGGQEGSGESTLDTSSSSSGMSGETTDASSSGSTTGAEAYCGDGVLNGPNADVPYPEECDDGNFEDDDGCGLCLRDRIVFISSETFHGYELNGLAGADARCRGLATLAGLPNAPTYKAWLSDSQTSASERMVHGLGRYVLVNGLVVAKSWKDLVENGLDNPINVTEQSLTKKDVVWTSTLPDGSRQLGADFCADWQEGFGYEAYVGWSDDVTLWTQLPPSDANPSVCDGDQSLYCFEQD